MVRARPVLSCSKHTHTHTRGEKSLIRFLHLDKNTGKKVNDLIRLKACALYLTGLGEEFQCVKAGTWFGLSGSDILYSKDKM